MSPRVRRTGILLLTAWAAVAATHAVRGQIFDAIRTEFARERHDDGLRAAVRVLEQRPGRPPAQ